MTKITAFNCPNCGAAANPEWVSCAYCHASISTRVCPACFHAVAIGMRHCQHCGAEASPPQPVREIEIKCPRCGSVLQAHSAGKHAIPVCPQCGGIWLDRKIFHDICTQVEVQQALLDFGLTELTPSSSGISPTGQPERTYVPCPECGKFMVRKSFARGSLIVIDWCRDHGVWLDRHELHHIAEFIRKGGMSKHRERELADLQWRKKTMGFLQQPGSGKDSDGPVVNPVQYELNIMKNAINKHQNTEPLKLIFQQIFGKL